MSGGDSLDAPVVSPEEYDADYYLKTCAGHAEWSDSDGVGQAGIYPGVLKRSHLEQGMTVIDVGAGRGELVALAAEQGAARAIGVEYSRAAVGLAAQTMQRRGVADRACVVLADARALPMPDSCADLVFMLDVIEHLAPPELARALAEAHRVLRPGGRLIGHTFPTRTIYDVTYRAMRVGSRIRGSAWPVDPRNEYEHRMHVNEQTLRALRTGLRGAGFRQPNVRFGEWLYTDFIPSERGRAAYRWLAGHRLTRSLAVADLWVDAAR